MAGSEAKGSPVECDIERREDDTDDITVRFSSGAADVIGWTAELSISEVKDGAPVATFSGTGIAGGLIPIDMDGFAVVVGNYKYDIRVVDTVTADAPSRVYLIGSFKVLPRIKP